MNKIEDQIENVIRKFMPRTHDYTYGFIIDEINKGEQSIFGDIRDSVKYTDENIGYGL